jgi:hypothetical protein
MKKRMAGLMLLLLVLSSAWMPAAQAAGKGNLTVRCETEKNGQKIYLSQDLYAVTRIAEAEIVNGTAIRYTACPDWKDYDRNWGELTAAQLRESAKELADHAASQNLYDQKTQTDSEGKAIFPSLGEGLYLVTRIRTDEKNAGYRTDPVLVSIPSYEAGNLLYDVCVDLKFEWAEKPDVPAEVPGGNTGDEADTGRLTALLLLGSLSFLSLVWSRTHRNGSFSDFGRKHL